MNISSITNSINSFSQNIINKNNKKADLSFGSIYVESTVELGRAAESSRFPPKFTKRDALLLNEIAQLYPNQDCFIRSGHANYPRLEFREKPADVQIFSTTLGERYKTEINPNNEEYPCVELLLTKEDRTANRIIGMQNFIATNPSLAFTISAGFEVHKKLLEKKYEILQYIGQGDDFNIGRKDVDERAHQAVKDIEIAVKRYLMESAYAALKDRASAEQIYASNLPKVQTRLDANRMLDLTTSVANRVPVFDEELTKDRMDICQVATSTYPDTDKNLQRIRDLEQYMISNRLVFS